MSDYDKKRREYLRRRYAKKGIDSLQPRDALELLLGYVYDGDNIGSLINELFDHYGSVSRILHADLDELAEFDGVNDEMLELFWVMRPLYSIVSTAQLIETGLDDVGKACDYFYKQLRWAPVEMFKLACLQDNFSTVSCTVVGEGNGSEVSVDIEAVITEAAKRMCRFVIIGHNHPSGSCRPSESDIVSTGILRKELKKCGIILLDHIIVGRDGVCSIMRSGEYPVSTDPCEIAEVLKSPR